jgi:hypothetical protein
VPKQGDQIERIFATCLLWEVFEKKTVLAHDIFVYFVHRKRYVESLTKMGWATCWAFFYKRIRSPCRAEVHVKQLQANKRRPHWSELG